MRDYKLQGQLAASAVRSKVLAVMSEEWLDIKAIAALSHVGMHASCVIPFLIEKEFVEECCRKTLDRHGHVQGRKSFYRLRGKQ